MQCHTRNHMNYKKDYLDEIFIGKLEKHILGQVFQLLKLIEIYDIKPAWYNPTEIRFPLSSNNFAFPFNTPLK